MRMTQTMLANNSLRYISQNYERLGRIQEQINTGKKISRPSDDPVIAMKGMRYRSQVTEVEQFKRNLSEAYNWMDTADSTLDKVTQTLQRVRELTVQAANDSYDPSQRSHIGKEIKQLREHLAGLGNTKVNNKYIFNGTNTTNQPINLDAAVKDLDSNPNNYVFSYEGDYFVYESGNIADGDLTFKNKAGESISVDSSFAVTSTITNFDSQKASVLGVSTNSQDVEVEVMKGIEIAVNINPQRVFSTKLFTDLQSLEEKLMDPSTDSTDLEGFLSVVDKHMDNVVAERAELGARYNRVEMIEDRLGTQEVVAKQILSDNEDIDFEKVIMELKTQESLHRAALAAGARIIQPTLLDFLR